MSFSCLFHVFFMSFSCLFHVFFHVFFMSFSCLFYVFFMSFSCLFHVYFMSFSCLFHVFFMSFSWCAWLTVLCRFVSHLRWHVRCHSTVAGVAVRCRHVAAVIRVGLLRSEGRRAHCRRPSALPSLTPTFGRLPALGHSCHLREISEFAVENFAVHVDWPVVMQSVAGWVSAQPVS